MAHVNTILGPIRPDEMGLTAMHEHLLWGPPGWEYDPEWWFSVPKVLRSCVDDLREFYRLGGRTFVDCSGLGLGRELEFYRIIARCTGVHVVACTGFWEDPGILTWFRLPDIDYLEELFVQEVTEGIGKTGIKAGIIKAANGISQFTALEERTFRAAARAARRTGAAVTTHGVQFALRQLQVLLEEKLDPERIIIGHLDTLTDIDLVRDKEIGRRGAYLGYDHIGTLDTWSPTRYSTDDDRRASLIKEMLDAGFQKQLIMSADVNSFSLGWQRSAPYVGKSAVGDLIRFLPKLRRLGVSDETIHSILVDNPRRVLPIQ